MESTETSLDVSLFWTPKTKDALGVSGNTKVKVWEAKGTKVGRVGMYSEGVFKVVDEVGFWKGNKFLLNTTCWLTRNTYSIDLVSILFLL